MDEQPTGWQPEYPPQDPAPPTARPARGGSKALKRVGLAGAGVVAGAVIATAVGADAATPSAGSTPSTSTSSPGSGAATPDHDGAAAPDHDGDHGSRPGGGGTFPSNEDPAHEKGESAAREAQENAEQAPAS